MKGMSNDFSRESDTDLLCLDTTKEREEEFSLGKNSPRISPSWKIVLTRFAARIRSDRDIEIFLSSCVIFSITADKRRKEEERKEKETSVKR